MVELKKIGMILIILLLCMAFSGCSEIGKLVQDVDNSDNPLSEKDTDERIIMCLEEEYSEHDFVVVESYNKENDSGKFQDENGIEFTVHGLVYDNTYHIQGHAAVMTFRFGNENANEETIRKNITDALKQVESNIEKDKSL